MVALYGLGGAGKTSVAVEYAHRHLAEVGVAWQFAAEDPAVLAAGFGELAAQLGAREPARRAGPGGVGARGARRLSRRVAAGVRQRSGPGIGSGVPAAGRARAGADHQPERDGRPGRPWTCRSWTREVAAGFLVNRTGDPDQPAATDLAAELGGLPLALEQAAAYIQATGTPWPATWRLFRQRRADLLARGEAAGHPADVAATLALALSRLVGKAPGAAGLSRLLACLAPEPVPVALLLADANVAGSWPRQVAGRVGPLLGDLVAMGDAVAALRRYSLVTPGRGRPGVVHRLVRHVTLDQVPADVADQWRQAAAALIEAAIPADPALPAAWPVCAVLLPHARAVLGLTSGGMWRIASYLGYSGSYPAARDLFQLIADAQGG